MKIKSKVERMALDLYYYTRTKNIKKYLNPKDKWLIDSDKKYPYLNFSGLIHILIMKKIIDNKKFWRNKSEL